MSNNQDLENLARTLLKTSQGAKVIANLDKISARLNTPEGKKVVQSLAGDGGDALKKAAGAASAGNADTAKNLLSSLLASKEGSALAKDIMDLVKEK